MVKKYINTWAAKGKTILRQRKPEAVQAAKKLWQQCRCGVIMSLHRVITEDADLDTNTNLLPPSSQTKNCPVIKNDHKTSNLERVAWSDRKLRISQCSSWAQHAHPKKENRKGISQNISVHNSSKRQDQKKWKYIYISDLSPWLKLNPSSQISYNNDNLCNAIFVMHRTYHLVPRYCCDVGSNSHLSRTWHFLTCLDYLIWCLYSQSSLSRNSGSNKNQSTSSSSNTISCVPPAKRCACLFLLQNPVQAQEKTLVPLQEGRGEGRWTARPLEESQPEGPTPPQTHP